VAFPPTGGSEVHGVLIVVYLAIIVLIIAGFWRVFTKAGEAGWKSIIPIWNLIVLLRIAGRPLWWIILLIIPLVNIIVYLIVMLDLAKSFGKGSGFGVGLWLLSFIFIPILGFGSATYQRGHPSSV
jgi:Family of unknown function (DUF5684)